LFQAALPDVCPVIPDVYHVSCCSEKSITKFATGLVDGSVEPEYKSAPIPDEPTDGGVTVVVGKNFDSIVKDKTKDVLLEVSMFQTVFGR
jgi:hypothetical protein